MLAPRNFSDLITFTRASSATRFNASGLLETVGNNVARLDFDPATLAARGLLREEQRTNSVRNSTMQGTVAGSPGTAPTGWNVTGSGGGVTRTIVGVSTENGITYLELRIQTTGATNFSIFFGGTPDHAAAVGQTWTCSAYVRLVGGSYGNVQTGIVIDEYSSAQAYLTGGVATYFTAPSIALSSQRYSGTRTMSNASTAYAVAYLLVATSGAADITLRIGLPQMEQGAFATSPIPTTNAAVTRSADEASVNTLSPWFNAAAGALYVEFAVAGYAPTNAYPVAATLSDGTGSYRITVASTNIGVNNNLYAYGEVVAAGGLQAGFYGATGSEFGVGATRKTATAYATNDFAFTTQGLTPQVDSSGVVPLFLNRLDLGAFFNSSQPINGWLRRLAYYPRRLSNAELQALTT